MDLHAAMVSHLNSVKSRPVQQAVKQAAPKACENRKPGRRWSGRLGRLRRLHQIRISSPWKSRTWFIAAGVALLGYIQYSFWQQWAAEKDTLQSAVNVWAQANGERARMAFDAGGFKDAVALLEPAPLKQGDSLSLQLLYARSLECMARFEPAAHAYALVAAREDAPAVASRAMKFCQRMCGNRPAATQSGQEADYRLFEELMRRKQTENARYVARRLMPDMEPLRTSVTLLLAQKDTGARISSPTESERVDVYVTSLTPAVADLLRDLRIGTLTVEAGGLRSARLLAELNMQGLNMAHSQVSEISELCTAKLERLNLSGVSVEDIRPLANLPLRELDLSETSVGSLMPLILCPIERLNLRNVAVHDLSPLQNLALRELNLSHTRVADLSPLSRLPLETLRLDDTAVHDLRPLAGMKLRKLSLVGTAVKDVSMLADMPLVELDLRGCDLLNDLGAIASCNRLERICLPDHLKPTEAMLRLPRLKFIEYDRSHRERRIAEVGAAKGMLVNIGKMRAD